MSETGPEITGDLLTSNEEGAAIPDSGNQRVEETATPLEITDFLTPALPDADTPELSADFPQQPLSPKLPRPGLLEAVAWMVGLLAVRVTVQVALGAAFVLLLFFSGSVTDLTQGLNRLLQPDMIVSLTGIEQFLFVLLVTAIVWVRYFGRASRTINLAPPRPLHALIIAGLVLPLSTLCTQLYMGIDAVWQALARWIPALSIIDSVNANEQINELVAAAPLPLMVLIIALAPALGEELLFRGMLGRGLVARWGLIRGVAITSVLFGMMHLHPVHAAAVIPLGIALHLIYLATRSFWAPVLLHFLNNALATVASKLAGGDVAVDAIDQAGSPTLILASSTAVIVLGALLYTTRTRYLQPNGEEWSPGYLTAEAPDPAVATRVDFCHISGRNLLTAATAWIAFGAAFAAEVAALAR